MPLNIEFYQRDSCIFGQIISKQGNLGDLWSMDETETLINDQMTICMVIHEYTE